MIKTRGYRVELGEIEAVMVAHPAVNEAVALAIPDDAIGNTIHAIVTINDGKSLTSTELKRHCAEKLPSYMVPEEIEFCETLPRTGTGKVDRQRLLSETIRSGRQNDGKPSASLRKCSQKRVACVRGIQGIAKIVAFRQTL